MHNIIEFENLTVCEQISQFGKMFNLKLKKKDFEEIKNFNLYTLLTDDAIKENIKNEKIRNLLKNIQNICEVVAYTKIKKKERLSSPEDVVNFLKVILKKSNENIIALYFNAQNYIIDYEFISIGTVARSAVYPAKIVKSALLKNARAVILSHNHPAGTLKPSENDIVSTKAVYDALKTVDICLLDHIIITNDDFYSFKNNGIL